MPKKKKAVKTTPCKTTPNKQTPTKIKEEIPPQFEPVLSPTILDFSPDKNLTGLHRTVRDNAADIHNNIQKWNTLHVKNAVVLKEFAMVKKNSASEYPKSLDELYQSLLEGVDAMGILVDNLKTCAKHYKPIDKLHKSPEPLFFTYCGSKFYDVATNISNCYAKEFSLKKTIVKCIPYVMDDNKLMFYVACWVHQPYITSQVCVWLSSLLVETGLKKSEDCKNNC